MAFILADPQTAFIDTLIKTAYGNNPLAPIAVPKPEYFDKINMKRAVDIYKERFSNAYGMNFAIVGSIDEAVLKPLVEKYIGGLPSMKKVFNFKDNGLRPVKGKVDLNVYKGQAEKSLILAMATGETPYSEDMEMKASALSEIINIKVIEELREKIQGIYGGGTRISMNKFPYQNYSAMLQLPCGPEKIDTLLKTFNNEVAGIKTNGPAKEDLDKVKAQWLESNKTAMKRNGTWLNYLLTYKMENKNIDRFLNYDKYVNALTAKDVQNVANLIYSGKNVVTAVLRPAKK